MGIREQGYRHWDGQYTSHAGRWWSIAKQGVRSSVFNRTRLVFILIFIAIIWVPFLIVGIIMYFTGAQGPVFECGSSFFGGEQPRLSPDEVFDCAMYDLVRGWQFLVLPPFVALIAAPLVSEDLRSNALYIYLSKPLVRVDYLLGKGLAVMLWSIPVTLLPGLFAWFMVVSTSNNLAKLEDPGQALFQVLMMQSFLALLFTLLALAFAVFTRRWWIAAISFLSAYYVPWFVSSLLREITREPSWFYASIVDNIVNFAQGLFGVPSFEPAWLPSFLILLAVIGGSAGAFVWRILKLEVAE